MIKRKVVRLDDEMIFKNNKYPVKRIKFNNVSVLSTVKGSALPVKTSLKKGREIPKNLAGTLVNQVKKADKIATFSMFKSRTSYKVSDSGSRRQPTARLTDLKKIKP